MVSEQGSALRPPSFDENHRMKRLEGATYGVASTTTVAPFYEKRRMKNRRVWLTESHQRLRPHKLPLARTMVLRVAEVSRRAVMYRVLNEGLQEDVLVQVMKMNEERPEDRLHDGVKEDVLVLAMNMDDEGRKTGYKWICSLIRSNHETTCMAMISAAVENGGGDNGGGDNVGGGYEVEEKFSYSSLVYSREALAQNALEL